MPRIDIGLIHQEPITKKRINEMITWRPRRMQLVTQWAKSLHEPKSEEENWSLVLPFCETFKNVFHSMCFVFSIGLREGSSGRCYTFLNDAKENEKTLVEVQKWLDIIAPYVGIRDCLALSFALDYDRNDGNPSKPPTKIGDLRRKAKPYDGFATPDTYNAADELVGCCLEFLTELNCYDSADAIVAMPPSNPRKPFNLPAYLAREVAEKRGTPNFSHAVTTVKERPSVRESELEQKLPVLEGTVCVDASIFKNKVVLLVDDIYQSGVSMNYVAMLLLEAGAKKVFGLACEKTCSNDDNISR